MIKDDLIKILSNSQKMKLGDAKVLTELLLDSIKQILVEEKKLTIMHFGIFKKQSKRSRVGRNPKNGKKYSISARSVISFRPSHSFRQELFDNSNKIIND